jgi:hypothetical protein
MRARLQRGIQVCSLRIVAGFIQGDNFGVGLASGLGEALPDDPTIPHEQRANRGVGSCLALCLTGKVERDAHVFVIQGASSSCDYFGPDIRRGHGRPRYTKRSFLYDSLDWADDAAMEGRVTPSAPFYMTLGPGR